MLIHRREMIHDRISGYSFEREAIVCTRRKMVCAARIPSLSLAVR
jgi:hypothetical protein